MSYEKYTVRMPAETWKKLGWAAAEQGATKQDLIRRLCTSASKNAKPPKAGESRALHAEAVEWEEWQKTANQLDTTVPQLVRRLMDQIGSKLHGPQ